MQSRHIFLALSLSLTATSPNACFAHGEAFAFSAPPLTVTSPLQHVPAVPTNGSPISRPSAHNLENRPTNFSTLHSVGHSTSNDSGTGTSMKSVLQHLLAPSNKASGNKAKESNAASANQSSTNSFGATGAGGQGTAQNLDLSSTSATLTAGTLMRSGSLTITVGGAAMQVTAQTQITPAEQLALYQVIFKGQQTIVLDAQGSATGGTVVINQHLSQNLGNLVIPQGVTVIDVSKSGNLNLSGNLTDDGSLYVVGKGGSSASIDANNIVVQAQGLISNVAPAGNSSTSGASQNSTFNLSAQNSISNAGTISSSGNLNLSSGSGSLTNSGTVRSSSADINIASPSASADININGSGGTFQAQNGNINVRDSSYTGAGNININGGNFLSNNLNLFSGSGTANTVANSIGGLLNVNAGQAHTLVSSGNLQLGTLNLTGDPTFYDSNGNITIGGNISVGEAFSAVASGNILSTGNYSITANNGAAGFQVNLIAGANISAPGSTPSSTVGPFTTSGTGTAAVNPIVIDGPSATGGDVTFSGHNMTISSAAVSGNNAGGDVNVIAFSNTGGTNGGHVLLSAGTSISSGGTGTGTNGNINILAGAPGGVAISTGSLNSSGGTGGGGDINVVTSQPTTPVPVTINPNGSIAVGNFVPGAPINPASVTINAPVTSGGNVNITSANTVAVNSTINATTAGKNITIQSPENLTVSGSGSLTTTATGTTALLAMSSGSTLTLANTHLDVNGGGEIDVRTPNLVLGQNSSLNATGASNLFIDAGNSAANVDLNITGSSKSSATISTNGGIIDISPTGMGNGNFLSSGTGNTTLNFNSAGSNGPGLVDVHGLGNFTIPAGVTFASNSPIQFNMNNILGNQTFTLNGTLKTTASNAAFPDPLGGTVPYSILIQNLITNYTIAGTGTILQAGKTPGNTVFNDFSDVGFANGTNLHISSINPGSYANFYTRQIQVNGPGAASASLSVNNLAGVNFNTNLPSFGPGDVAFVGGPAATSANFTVSGAPINVGFQGSPPVSIPALQEPVGNITIGQNFTFNTPNTLAMAATNSVAVLGTINDSAGNGQLTVRSPGSQALNLSGGGTLHSARTVLNSSGSGVNFNSNLNLPGGATYIGATDGAVTIAQGSNVSHAGPVFINSPRGIPSGFTPAAGVFQTNRSPNPNRTAVSIITPSLVVSGTINATGASPLASAQSQGASAASPLTVTAAVQQNRSSLQQGQVTPATNAAVQQNRSSLQQGQVTPATNSSVQQNRSPLQQGQVTLATNSAVQQNRSSLQHGQVTIATNAVGQAAFSGATFSNNRLKDLANQGIVFGQNSNSSSLDLINGKVLFMPQSDIRVRTNAGNISIPKGAAAWIVQNGAETAVFDLHDNNSGRVRVTAGNKELPLTPGSEVLLSKNANATFDSLNADTNIAHTNVKQGKLADGTRVFVSDFSISHGLANIPVVHNLLESNDPAQRKAAWTMIKDAAILADLNGTN